MPLATLDDINVHLAEDKLEVLDADDEFIQLDAERVIKGYLAGVYSPTTLAGWSDPEVTDSGTEGYVPSTIKAIAGRFIAAAIYKKRYSEDTPEVPEYAQDLYDQGLSMLRDVKSGAMVLDDVSEIVDTGQRLTRKDFWPNDDAGEPSFAMDMEF